MDCSQSLMLKAVLRELLMQLHWLNRKHCASDGCRLGSRSQLCPVPTAGAPTLRWGWACAGWNVELAAGGNPEFTHHVQHTGKLECTIAPCFKYQIKSSESGISEGKNVNISPRSLLTPLKWGFCFQFFLFVFCFFFKLWKLSLFFWPCKSQNYVFSKWQRMGIVVQAIV